MAVDLEKLAREFAARAAAKKESAKQAGPRDASSRKERHRNRVIGIGEEVATEYGREGLESAFESYKSLEEFVDDICDSGLDEKSTILAFRLVFDGLGPENVMDMLPQYEMMDDD